MARPWIRLYTSICDSAKIQRLPDNLFKFLINCWALTGDNEDVLPSSQDVAWRLRMDLESCEANIKILVAMGLLVPGEQVIPHNWKERQFLSDDSKKRVKKFREKLQKRPSNGVGNGHVTANVTCQDTEQNQIQNRTDKNSLPDSDIAALAESLHARHPANGCGRAVIVKHLTTIVRGKSSIARATTLALIDENHAAWCATSDWQRGFAKGLENWLAPSMMRWKDGPKTKPKTLNNNGNAEKILIDKSREWLADNPEKTINDYVDWSIQNQ